ncbi:MAG: acetyltransferase [Ferruginibacter sp.]|nr:acetyltransferase [Ferruginibacter sp.]
METNNTYVGTTFSLKNRVGRVIWSIASVLLFRVSPKPLHSWRSFLLRCFGAKIGKAVHVYPGARIWAPWNLELADGAAVATGAILYTQGKITIGKKAVISQGAHLCAGTHDYNLPGFPLYTRPIIVGDQAWIAAEAFIHPGVTIGEGCVIGARSVVTRDMPSWMVCAGHPCKPIKERDYLSIP